ncbi:hypothetical protein TPA0907_63190 [Micromonospora humidisoli]|nr:hypothetical protein TPA0907_63190 [Micromonospora sp. AKA109]
MKAHRTDLVSFVFGLLFVGLALWWLLAQILGLALPAVGWFLAGALVLIGLLGLVGAVRSARTVDAGSPAADSAATPTPAPVDPVGGQVGDPADEPGRPDTVERRPDEPARIGDGDTRRWPADDPVTGPPGTPPPPPS